MTSTPSATLLQSTNTPTATHGTSSYRTAAPGGTSQSDSLCRVVSSPASVIASTSTPLRILENLPTLIPHPEALTIITNPLQIRGTERYLRQREWQLQLQAVSTPHLVVSGSCSIHGFGHSDTTGHIFPIGRLMELHMWNKWLLMSACELEMVNYAT